MFLGHLPAGYILTKSLQKKWHQPRWLWLGLLGSVFPDFDIFYFYLIDGRQHSHHSYWIHIPFYWIVITATALLLLRLFKKTHLNFAVLIFFSNVFLHLVLDTIVGEIEWLYPFTETAYALFEVPDVYDFWVWNFFFHWTFLFELGVIGSALYLRTPFSQRGSKETKNSFNSISRIFF